MSGSPDCAAPTPVRHDELMSSGTETTSVPPRAASLNTTQQHTNSDFALFSVSSPRRLGESLRSAASSHFPTAIDRIVKESSLQRSQSKRAASHNLDSDADHVSEIASEDHAMSDCGTVQGSTSTFLRNVDAPESSDSFAHTSSFASNQNNSMIAAGTATATVVAPPQRKKSFFASLLESSPSPAPPPAAQPAAAGAKVASDVPRKSYRCKLSLLGESGSGKTTFQRCVTQSVLRTLPDVTPSISSSSSLYYYRSSTRREKLDMLLVDAGPDPLSTLCGLGCVMEQTNCFSLVMSLAGIKQRTSKKFLSFGNEPSAIVHARDKAMIRSHLSAICATMDDSLSTFRPPKIVVIGTHKDFLTDQSREAVETVLREVNRVVADVLREFRVAPMLIGCFAISCLDHTCVPENRGGPRGINELWNFLCEVNLKDATLAKTRALVSEPPIRWEELSEKMAFEAPVGADNGEDAVSNNSSHQTSPKHSAMWLFTRSATNDGSQATSSAVNNGDGKQPHTTTVTPTPCQQLARQQIHQCSSPIPLTIRNSDLAIITDRVVTFVRRAKTELNFVVVHTRALRQVAFSLGVFSKDHLDAILRMLSRDGEILLLDHQPHHVGGREDSVVLWPHLAHRAVAALSRYHSTFGHWTSSTAGASGVPGVDPDECRKADVDRKALTHGVFSPGLVVALSRSLPQTRRPIVERAETFALLLLLSDFVFQRRCRKRHHHQHHATHHHPHRAGTPQEQRTTRDASVTTPPPSSSLVDDLDVFVANVVAAVKSPSTSMASRNASMVAIPSHQPAADDTSAADHVSVGTNPASLHSSSWGVEYVAPSLALHKIPANIPPFFMKALQRSSDHGELLLGAFAAKAVRRTLRVPHCPPHVLHRMMCRWSPYIVPTSLVFSNAIFLRRTVSSLHNTNDDVNIPGAQRSGHDGSFMLDEDHEDEHLQSPTSYRQHDQQRQTRCLVFSEIVDSKDDASSVGATTPISGTMLVHVCVVSSEDLLVVAHFINTILRAACQVLDYSFPGLSWSVEGVPQSTGPQNSLPCDDDDDVFLDIPSVSALDAMFSDPSLPASEQQFADADTEAAATLLLTKASL